jgi:Domain of unknown function (DUF222)
MGSRWGHGCPSSVSFLRGEVDFRVVAAAVFRSELMTDTDAMAFDRRLDELAATVCPADPHTKAQRRADALSALAARVTAMPCWCG